MIRVRYHNNKDENVQPWMLETLIESNKIQAFQRATGWVVIGRDRVRRPGGFYSGAERRQPYSYPLRKLTHDELARSVKELRQEAVVAKRREEELLQVRGRLARQVQELANDLVSANRELEAEIAARKQLDEELRESNTRYSLLFNEMLSGFAQHEIICDESGKPSDYRFLAANPAFEKITGVKVADILDKTVLEILPGTERHWIDTFGAVALGGKPVHIENYSRELDRYFDVTAYSYEHGKFAVIFNDITDRKRHEEAVKKSSERIKLFAYSVSHDLKTPAIAIFGLTKLLHKQYSEVLAEKGRNYCDQILRAAEQMLVLVDKINLYITAKENPITIERLNLAEMLQTIEQEFASRLDSRGITWSVAEDMPEIMADKVCIMRVLRNMVDNALKYGGDRLSEIAVSYKDAGKHHVLRVRDDGVGVPKEDSRTIFGLFKRKKTSTGVDGAGLGLAIVKEIAEQHKGKAWVVSGPKKKGSTFCMSIAKDL